MSKDVVFSIVKEIIMEILPGVEANQITVEKSLKDLGANSIDRMEVVTLSMEKLDISLPLMAFSQVSDIQGIIEVLNESKADTPM